MKCFSSSLPNNTINSGRQKRRFALLLSAGYSDRWGAPEKPARCEGVKVSDSEGLASHTGPESCVVVGDGCGEALAGERAGRVLSPEIKVLAGCRRAPNTRKATRFAPVGRGVGRPGGVGDPWHARKHLVRDPGGRRHWPWGMVAQGPHGEPQRVRP